MLQVTALNIFPVKSLQGISLTQAKLGVRGLEYDRNWMITDENYEFVTQRQIPKMATIKVSITETELVLEHESANPLVIRLECQTSEIVKALVWKDSCDAIDEGEIAAQWLSDVLGNKQYLSLRLLRFSNNYKRKVEADYLQGEEAHTAFSDGYPYLITVEESLAALNKNLEGNGAQKVVMGRFRPNIVIKGLEAFTENELEQIVQEAGSYKLGLRKPCQRCKITTVDQKTGVIRDPKEPLRTLSKINKLPDRKGAFFGQNATLLNGDGMCIKVGDRLLS